MVWTSCCIFQGPKPSPQQGRGLGTGDGVHTSYVGILGPGSVQIEKPKMLAKEFTFNRVGSREPFLLREGTNAIKEERYYGLKLSGGLSIWWRKEDRLKGW